MRFDELNLNPKLLRAIAERGYVETTDVQTRTLAETLLSRDAAIQSQTGTGKTAAFLVTVFDRLLRDSSRKSGRTLIVAPTRELAVQIEGEADLLNKHLGYTIGCFYGGVGYEQQEAVLRKGADILIGTPGRLLDLEEKGILRLGDIRILVIDEADRLFDMGFLPDIKKIVRKLPPAGRRQSLLFSATLNRLARRVAAEFLKDPVYIELTPEQVTVEAISQELYRVGSHLKANLLLGLLKAESPRNALIFTNTRHAAERLAKKLERNGYRGCFLTGDLPQKKRMKIIDDFSAGRFPFLVATDVAARGLHIEGLEMVVNYDLPEDIENYVHRIGRTGRAGQAGKAVSLACEKYGDKLSEIETYIGMRIPLKTATPQLYVSDRGFEAELKAREERKRSGGFGRGRGFSGDRRSARRDDFGSRRNPSISRLQPAPQPE
ncbi:MAG: DEAD/DEAH box helicase [Candidatus Aminicenantes bacterium]|nr:DEAD/DEAH box helicase [Candidatus Aminicenantes bacterium]